jgi:hypothetical protein
MFLNKHLLLNPRKEEDAIKNINLIETMNYHDIKI